MSEVELCFSCDEPTGRAGQGEDSLYSSDGDGPYCETCWDDDGYDENTEQLEAKAKSTMQTLEKVNGKLIAQNIELCNLVVGLEELVAGCSEAMDLGGTWVLGAGDDIDKCKENVAARREPKTDQQKKRQVDGKGRN